LSAAAAIHKFANQPPLLLFEFSSARDLLPRPRWQPIVAGAGAFAPLPSACTPAEVTRALYAGSVADAFGCSAAAHCRTARLLLLLLGLLPCADFTLWHTRTSIRDFFPTWLSKIVLCAQ
jgi:hypothetical protein